MILKPETLAGTRKEADIAAVLGFVNDADADKGKAVPALPGAVTADYIIESSAGNFQEVLWLDRPLPPNEAKAYANALKRATGADAANEIGHVWRVPGGLNWPNAVKVHERGRSRDPQPVTVKQPWTKWTRVADLRAALQDHWKAPRTERTPGVASPDAPKFEYDRVARWIDRKIEHKWQDDPTSPWNDQGAWILFGKAIKISFPNEDGLELWMRVTHNEQKQKDAERRWNNHSDFKPEMYDGALTLKNERYLDSGRDVDWMFGDVTEAIARGETWSPPLAPIGPLPAGTPTPGPCEIEDDEPVESIRPRRISAASLEGKPIPEREWLVRDLIPAKNVTLLYGDGATGKSLLALQLAAAVVTGFHFFARQVQQGPVEFITAEDSQDEMHRRLVSIAHTGGYPLAALSGLHLTSLAEADALLAVPQDSRGGALAATALYNELENIIDESRPAVVFLDTLADVYGGNEIVRAQVRQFIGMLRRLAMGYGCTIVVLAHPSLAGMERGTSGSTGWSNSVRSRIYLKRIHEKDGREADEDARVLSVEKLNYGRLGLEISMRWQSGVFVPMTIGPTGDPMVAAAKAERVFLDLLRKFIGQNRYVSTSEGKSYAPFIFAKEAALHGVNKSALKEAMERLLAKGTVENAPHGAPSKKMYRLYVSPDGVPAGVPTPANAMPAAC